MSRFDCFDLPKSSFLSDFPNIFPSLFGIERLPLLELSFIMFEFDGVELSIIGQFAINAIQIVKLFYQYVHLNSH